MSTDPLKRTFLGYYEYISALTGCCALKFLHALQIDQALLAHTGPGRGVPPQKKFNRVLGVTTCCSIVRLATARTTTMTSPPPPRCRKSARTHITVMRDKRVQIHTSPYFPTAITFHVNHVTQHASKLSVYDY